MRSSLRAYLDLQFCSARCIFFFGPGSSPSTTVIVSNEHQSRTCIHTTGDATDLRAEDVRALDIPEGSHFHFDTRQTKAAYSLVI